MGVIFCSWFQLITAAKSNPQKKWRMCCRKGVPKEICYRCWNCFDHPGLCPAPCFEEYHRIKTWYRKHRAEATLQRCSCEKVFHLSIRTSWFLWKGILINMQQIYRRAPMLKCDINKAAWQITLQHGCSPVNLLHIYKNTFL